MSTKKIIKPISKWKFVLGLLISLFVVYLAMILYSEAVKPNTESFNNPYTQKEIIKVVESRTIPEKIEERPQVTQIIPEKEYKESEYFYKKNPKAAAEEIIKAQKKGNLPTWYPKGEAPVLSKLVEEGKLPSVVDRVGTEPVVLKGADGIGKYGGTWLRAASSEYDVSVIGWRLAHSRMLRFSPLIEPMVLHIAKSVKMLDNGKVWVVKLRKIKWSDGVPISADDVMFWWNAKYKTKAFGGNGEAPQFMMIAGEYGYVEKIDDMTVKFVFPKQYGSFKYRLARAETMLLPAHYLKKYHPDYGDPIFIKKEMKRFGLASPRQLFEQMGSSLDQFMNPECPVLTPWVIRTYKTQGPYTFIRNPYYFAVDEAGNQLPYIDRVQFDVVSGNMIPILAANGKISMQGRHIKFSDYTDLMSQSKKAGTKIYFWISGDASQWLISPNLNRRIKKDEPSTKWKAKLLGDKRFRQALSLAIDRKKISKAIYYNLAKPGQVEPGPFSSFQSETLKNAYIEYDPEKANKLLDEAWKNHGLDPDERSEGYRTTPDGKLLTFYLTLTEFNGLGPAQFVVDDWKKIGIRCVYRIIGRDLFTKERNSRDFDFIVWDSEGEVMPLLSPRCFIPYNSQSHFALGWSSWAQLGGLYGKDLTDWPGAIPIPKDHPMYKALIAYDKALQATTVKKQKKYLDEVFNIDAENLWTINICRAPPRIIIADADMKNIPEKAVYSTATESPGNTSVETYYFEHPDKSTDKDTIKQLSRIVPWKAYRPSSGESNDNSYTSKILMWIFILIVCFLLILLILKHPFILRRIFIMIPTLLVISICVFTIIQMPPGTFLDYRIMEMEAEGRTQDMIEKQTNEMKDMFHFDDPSWKRYLRWMGFKWFVTFNPNDKGLLQGDMGRSMQTLKSVNQMVGDRVLLTFLISLGTVLLTWLIAIPIGIFSACRKYSKGDYIFTFLGFLGMSIPGFLLAIVFIALTGKTGLFSAQYMVQPYWDISKVIDLLKHIWIPIVIVGVGSTAGMIRVLRANLIDELNKPYVTTARAKGVRPLKLLFKYPVRIAINPFVSGIGAYFPLLISGTSIVAIVLILPTVGPLMLDAFLCQDMNMAGSMLMVLSTLAVLGTLVSDLLLLALDPRIRIGGGSK
jgi:ABC-type dipeptide/oligopeptide/nickel transport system permease component/ABC-type transport system substrate-binding protein